MDLKQTIALTALQHFGFPFCIMDFVLFQWKSALVKGGSIYRFLKDWRKGMDQVWIIEMMTFDWYMLVK